MSLATNQELVITGLNKTFTVPEGQIEVLKDISLTVNDGEFISIVGASGCGKSTLLRIVVGLENIDNGSIYIGNQAIAGVGEDRGMIFQESRLLPWLTVEQNIAFGISEKSALTKKQRAERVRELLQLVGIAGFAKAFPHQLSGGMQQRVSIARSLIGNPKVLLLDEPFGALDALTRINMQHEVLKIWERERTTMLLVTHDIDEAIYLGDRVVVMSDRPGTIKKTLPVELPRPRDRSAAEFIRIRREIYNEFFTSEDLPFAYHI